MAYNLPMQISLQKPDPGNVAEIKKSIETGLRYINLGAVTDTSIRAIKKTVRAANIGNVSVVLSGPSPTNLASIKKTIEASLSSINIGIDAKIAELNKVAKAISSASKSPGQQKELSPERAKALNKKTDADIKRADKRGEAQVKKDLMQAAAIFKKSVSEAAARLEVALGKKEASVIVAKGVAKGKPASMLVESRGKADATRAVGDARAEVTRKRGDQKVIDDQKRADKQRVNDTKKSNAAIRRANRDQAARIAERNDPNAPANVRATARTTATVGTSNARTAAVNSKSAADVQGKLAKDAATVAATNARAAATNTKAAATVAATNARAAATSQKGINDTAIANARAAAIAQRAADQTKKNEASIANLRSKSVSQINGINSSLERGAKSGNKFFDAIAGKAQSFAAYAVASTAIIKLSGFVTSATEDAIKYEKELINISQTTGDSIALTNVFSKSLENISKKYNITLSKTAQLTRTLAQAGLSIREATQAVEILARTSLLAGFDDLTSTTEGFIAVMETFNLSVARAGKVLESINTISNAYAVESSDLVQAISRTGGAFAAAGGSVEELLALITAVRSTTRESAETISTGFRTIFARLERPKTIEYFKKLGIQLETAEGQFIGPYQSILAISKGLQELNIQVGSTKFAQIIEEIGGIRQISKVIPLLTQTKKAQEALNLAFDKGPETLKSIEKAQQGLGYRLGALQKEFAALIAQTVDSKGFKILADIFINLSKSVMQFASTLKPLLSLLAPVAALLAGRAAGQALQGGGLKNAFGPNKDVRKRNKLERQRNTIAQGVPTQAAQERTNLIDQQLSGITTLKRAAGGPVPGSGSGDTVPAMLTPGEYVINKASAQGFGYGNLAKINRYAKGGVVGGYDGIGANTTGTLDDLDRPTGRLIKNMEDLEFVFGDITRYMGEMGKVLSEIIKLGAVDKSRSRIGNFSPSRNAIEVAFGKAGTSTVKHEVGHAADFELGKNNQYASNEKGTLQNYLAELIKPLLIERLRSQGVTKGSHKTNSGQDLFSYRTRNEEIFADLFEGSDTPIRGILANITDVQEGSKQLAELFKKYPERIKVMFAGIEKNIPEIQKVKTDQANEGLLNEAISGSSSAMDALLAKIENIGMSVGINPLPQPQPQPQPKPQPQPQPKPQPQPQSGLTGGGPVFGPPTIKENYKQIQSDIRRDRYSARTEDDFTLGGPEKVKKQQGATRIATNTSPLRAGIAPEELAMLENAAKSAGMSLKDFTESLVDETKELIQNISMFSTDIEAQKQVRETIGRRLDPNITEKTSNSRARFVGQRLMGAAGTINTRANIRQAEIAANAQAKADRKKTQAANIASKNDQNAQAAARKAAKQAGDPSKTSLGNPIQDTLDLIIKLNSLGDDLDPEVVKGISTRLGRVSKSIEIAGQDYIKKAKAYNETIDPKTGQGDPLLKAMALGARDRYKATKASAGERKTQAITKAAQEGLPAEFGVAIVEMVDQINHLNGKVEKASEDLKKASEEEQKAIAAENKAKAKVLKDWMDSPLLASAGGSREDRLKEAQDIVKNSPDSPEVAAAKAATAKASASKQAAQAVFTNANQKANQFTGAGGVLAGTNAGYQPPTPPTPPVGPPVDAFIKGLNKATKALNKLPTFIESAVYAQTVASTIGTVSGKEINQGALTTGMTKGAMFSGAGDAVSAAMTRKNIFLTGKALEKLPGPFAKFGGSLIKNAGNIAIAGKLFAKGLNAASLVELGGGLFDSLFSTDFAKLRDQQVELGNSVAAAAAATRAYSQEFYRGIPLVGGFLAGLGAGSGVLEENLDSNGKLAVATARLAAEINRTSTESIRSQQKYSNAGLEQDIGKRVQGQNIAVQEQLDQMGLISQQSDELTKRREEASGASLSNSIGKGLITTGTGLGGSAFAGPAAPLVAAGSVIAGIGVAAYDYSTSLTMSTEQIVKSYEIQGKKLQKASEIQSKLISDFGTRVKNAAISSIRAGGNGYEQAIDNVSKQYGGKDKVKQITGGFEFTGDMAKDRTKLDEMINIKKSERESLESGLANINPSEKKQVAAQQDKINQAKVAEQTAIDLKNLVDQTYYAAEAEKVLMARRKVAAESMAYQIRIMKQLESAFDGLNSKFADLNNIAEELDNVGTGRLTNRQAASRVGLNSQLLETDARDIMRNPDLAMQADRYATEAGAQTKDDPEISNALGRINAIDAIGRMAKDKKLGDLLAPEGEAATDPKEIASTIKKQLEDQGYNVEDDKMLKEAIQTYSDKISQGYEYAAEAENDAREKATENAIKIIEKTQEAQNKVRDAEKQLRERQIELINRQLENAKAVYDAEKSYFDERLSLNQKVSDALQTEPVGPKKAGFLGQKALATRNSQMAALSARTGGANIGQSISANTNRLNVLRNDKGNDNSVEMATLKGNLELLSQAVRDQIDIENQYLDGLIDMAKAQQEYTQSLYDAQGSIVRDLVTGTDQEVGQQLTTLNAAAIASQQGSFAGIPETLKKDIFSLFDQFGDVTIPGLGKTGRDAQREITKNEMMKKFGVDSATAEQLAKKAVNDKVPIDEKMAQQIENQRQVVLQSMNDEHNLKLNQIAMEVKNTEQFALGVMEFRATVNEMITKLGISSQNQPPNAIPNANQPVVMAPQNNNATPQQVKMETNGEQTMTVNLAGLQAVATNAITAMIYEQVSQAFTNLSQETRTANNFEDLSNVFANAATKTQTVEMGNV